MRPIYHIPFYGQPILNGLIAGAVLVTALFWLAEAFR